MRFGRTKFLYVDGQYSRLAIQNITHPFLQMHSLSRTEAGLYEDLQEHTEAAKSSLK